MRYTPEHNDERRRSISSFQARPKREFLDYASGMTFLVTEEEAGNLEL
jgi:hypothetical protein